MFSFIYEVSKLHLRRRNETPLVFKRLSTPFHRESIHSLWFDTTSVDVHLLMAALIFEVVK
jgi:hypothetical protein